MASLARRQSDLEDVELEVMERLEAAQAALTAIAAERDEKEARRRALDEEAAALLADLDRDRAYALESRAAVAAGIPADLMALYEKIRARENGVGAAALTSGAARAVGWSSPRATLSRMRDAAPGRGAALRAVPADPGAHARVRAVSLAAGGLRVTRRSSSRPTAAPGATPARRRTARSSATRRPARCWPSGPRRSASPATTWPSTAA